MINDLLHVANSIWISTDTPVSLGCYLRAKYGAWEELARMSVLPGDYNCSDDFKVDNQAVGFLRKCKDLPTGLDLEEAARATFLESEQKCCHTNSYFSKFLNKQGPFGPKDERRLELIALVRKEITKMLGSPPTKLELRLGPGSTLSDAGIHCTVPHKFCSEPTVTRSAFHLFPMWAQTAWARNLDSRTEIRVVDHDKWSSVDKDALKQRGISTQPSINVAYQLAVGRFMRKRLLTRQGIHLGTLQHVHRRKAMEASLSGAAATIDLSNASDTVAKNIVQLFFTHEWFHLLNSIRVPFTEYQDALGQTKRLYLEKFSGMGNGYTFELETIIFLAICRVVCGTSKDVSVYGDDIIVPSPKAELVLLALKFFGFQPNLKKTFLSGRFRESCGGDYFDGNEVRPHFQEIEPSTPQEWISLANGLRRVWCENSIFDGRFLKAWHMCLEKIPSSVRACRGPSILGDIVIHDTVERWQTRVKDSIRTIRVWIPFTFKVFGWSRFPPGAVHASALYGVSNPKFGIRTTEGQDTSAFRSGVIPRDGVTGFHRAWVPFS